MTISYIFCCLLNYIYQDLIIIFSKSFIVGKTLQPPSCGTVTSGLEEGQEVANLAAKLGSSLSMQGTHNYSKNKEVLTVLCSVVKFAGSG